MLENTLTCVMVVKSATFTWTLFPPPLWQLNALFQRTPLSPMWHLSPTKPGSQMQVVLFMVSWQRPLSQEVVLHWAVERKETLRKFLLSLFWNSKQPTLLTFITNSKFPIGTFFVVPLSSVVSLLHIDLHTKLCAVVVVGLVCRPRLFTDPRAVIPNPGPGFIFLFFSDSNPVIRTPISVWQDWHQIVVLVLVLDDHHVCETFLAPHSGLGPVHSPAWVVVRPAQSCPNQKAS